MVTEHAYMRHEVPCMCSERQDDNGLPALHYRHTEPPAHLSLVHTSSACSVTRLPLTRPVVGCTSNSCRCDWAPGHGQLALMSVLAVFCVEYAVVEVRQAVRNVRYWARQPWNWFDVVQVGVHACAYTWQTHGSCCPQCVCACVSAATLLRCGKPAPPTLPHILRGSWEGGRAECTGCPELAVRMARPQPLPSCWPLFEALIQCYNARASIEIALHCCTVIAGKRS